MKSLLTPKMWPVALAVVFTAASAHAQFPGGFGGFGGQGGATRSRSANTRQYPNNTTVGDAVISIDPETRSLVVIADEETSQHISQVVSNLDRPKPQVLIKVVFLEVAHNDGMDLGIEGGWSKWIGNSTTGAVSQSFGLSGIGSAAGTNSPVNIFGQPLQGFAGTPSGGGLYQLFATDYQVTLHAVAASGKAKILSRPSIVARNNQPATITVGQSVPLITGVRYDNYGNVINTVSYQDVGIILQVTPFITSEGMVEMIVSPQTSDLADRSQWVPISSGSQGTISAPVINSRAADTVVVTPDGQTVIIGGLMSNTKNEVESKIPWLGDIPYLGALFRRRVTTDQKTELLIFLTPYLVQTPTELAALSTHEREKSDGPKAFTEKELNKYLETIPYKEPTAVPTNNVPPPKTRRSQH